MLKIFLIIGFPLLLIACSSSQQPAYHSSASKKAKTSPYYTTSFPDRDVSVQLERGKKAILRIVSTGFYETYVFEPKHITLSDLSINKPEDIASTRYNSEESAAGTAILLEQGEDHSLLITCEHIVSFPDTLISYYPEELPRGKKFIESVSIRQRQTNMVYTPLQFQKFDIIATDAAIDLALLAASIPDEVMEQQLPLSFSPGHTKNIQFGSFLYILGFPKGYPMVTRGLANTSANWTHRFFITDALFNPGISGGLIIGSNTAFQSFEWVGMANSATATREYLLVPRPKQKYTRAISPYRDSLFVQEKSRISYGITQAIPISRIKRFITQHQDLLRHHGFQYEIP